MCLRGGRERRLLELRFGAVLSTETYQRPYIIETMHSYTLPM